MDPKLGAGVACALLFVLAGCGRTGLDPRVGATTSVTDASVVVRPDLARSDRPADARVCRWTGFAPQTDYSGVGDSIAVGDLDGDGRDDIVISAWGNGVHDGTASVFVNRGDGTFKSSQTFATNVESQSVVVGDFSGDGRLDFAVVNGMSDLQLFVNLGNAVFASGKRLKAPESVVVMTAADFNRDGHADLALTTPRQIGVLLGDGAGGFADPLTFSTGSNANSIAVDDFNRDGFPDLVVTNADWEGTCPGTGLICTPTGLAAGTVNVLLNQGDGTFAPQSTYAAGIGSESVTTGDFDGDGVPDIAATNSVDDTLSVFLNAGDGSFGPQATYANAGSGTSALGQPFPWPAGGVATADFDGDGHTDIVVAHGLSDRNSVILVLTNQGDGSFRTPLKFAATGLLTAFAVGDFNGDGAPDLAAVMDQGTLSVFLSKCD